MGLSYRDHQGSSIGERALVMSSGVCKNSEGASLPFQVETMKDRIDDPIDAGHVHKAHHGSSAPPDLYKNTLDDVGGAKFAPQVPRKTEEAQ